jgi:hypothetical protein
MKLSVTMLLLAWILRMASFGGGGCMKISSTMSQEAQLLVICLLDRGLMCSDIIEDAGLLIPTPCLVPPTVVRLRRRLLTMLTMLAR